MSKKRYYKGGDPDVYKDFNDDTWKNMTVREKAMWSPYSDIEQAPIPADVVEFQKGQEEAKPCEDEKCKKLEDEVANEKMLNSELTKRLVGLEADNDKMREALKHVAPELSPDNSETKIPDPLPKGFKQKSKKDNDHASPVISSLQLEEDAQKKILIEELRKLGIKSNMNYKIETLQKKLKDANN